MTAHLSVVLAESHNPRRWLDGCMDGWMDVWINGGMEMSSYRAVEFPCVVHGYEEMAIYTKQSHHTSLNWGYFQEACQKHIKVVRKVHSNILYVTIL